MKTVARIIIIIGTLVTMGSHAGAAAAADWQPAIGQRTVPEVAVTVIYSAPPGTNALETADGFQMEWDSPVAQHGEEWCQNVECVNSTLTKIGQEWSYSVAWQQA